ncbi:hypothetical protein [Pseudomonas sp. DG56-2]|uniref:hypothetical protein n=1 Tax=Pseudomonas sp. DG56-2 TaxID=2320270 RepID=UPI0010A5FF1F|nr:hypothetical protein [Pseudomonas sp. DG56-2]
MINQEKKFNLAELAHEAYCSCFQYGIDKSFKNDFKNPSKFLLVSRSNSSIDNASFVFYDYFKSIEYENSSQKRVHLYNLDEHDYDYSSIRICKARKYKAVSSASRIHELTTHLASNELASVNKVEIDATMRLAFDELLHPDDFFKFHEVRYEYRVSISLVKNRKVVKTIKCNLGNFTLIQTLKPFDFKETEGEEVKATRLSLSNPVYRIADNDVMVTFNESKKSYREVVDMLRI